MMDAQIAADKKEYELTFTKQAVRDASGIVLSTTSVFIGTFFDLLQGFSNVIVKTRFDDMGNKIDDRLLELEMKIKRQLAEQQSSSTTTQNYRTTTRVPKGGSMLRYFNSDGTPAQNFNTVPGKADDLRERATTAARSFFPMMNKTELEGLVQTLIANTIKARAESGTDTFTDKPLVTTQVPTNSETTTPNSD